MDMIDKNFFDVFINEISVADIEKQTKKAIFYVHCLFKLHYSANGRCIKYFGNYINHRNIYR